MSSHEIIDLTTSPSIASHSLNAGSTNPISNVPPAKESRRRRKKRTRKSSVNSTPTTTSHPSARNSTEPEEDLGRVKRQRVGDTDLHKKSKAEGSGGDNVVEGGQGDENLFFVDLAPVAIPSALLPKVEKAPEETSSTKLLVPAHVTVLGSTPVEIIPQNLSDSEDDDFIDYLDYEDSKHTLRYYDEPEDEAAVISRTVCKNCGAEGQHKTSACPVQICLTCGVRDEHSTRSCPISKVCFTCGMKGHINANCPNRRSARALMSSRENECDRCSSSRHKTNECPTLWRLYEYLTSEEQTHTLALRQTKKDLPLGQGGEGFVAEDEWCYNCGSCGHWGDECEDLEEASFSEDFSAFSIFNVMNGPFYDPSKESKNPTIRPRRTEPAQDLGSWGAAPQDVGRQGRIKSQAALAKQAQETEEDPEDWFTNSAKRSNTSNQPSKDSKKISFGKSFRDSRSYDPPANHHKPSLLERLNIGMEDSYSSRSSRREHHTSSSSRHSSSRRSNHDRHRRDERYSSDRHRQSDSGPRYKGGYAR